MCRAIDVGRCVHRAVVIGRCVCARAPAHASVGHCMQGMVQRASRVGQDIWGAQHRASWPARGSAWSWHCATGHIVLALHGYGSI